MASRVSGGYGHSVRRIGPDHFRLGWTVDYKYPTSRLRYPRGFDRDTDLAGAKRFAKRWRIEDPRTIAMLEQG